MNPRALRGNELEIIPYFSLFLWPGVACVGLQRCEGRPGSRAAGALVFGILTWNRGVAWVGRDPKDDHSLLFPAATCSSLRKSCESVTYWSSGFAALQARIDAAIIQVKSHPIPSSPQGRAGPGAARAPAA